MAAHVQQGSTMTRKEMDRIKRTSLPPDNPLPRSPVSPQRVANTPGGPLEGGGKAGKTKNVNMEQSICQVYASVMLYDDSRRQWLPSGGTMGLARVHIYHHQSNNQYRVVGRLMSDQSVVINCAILKGLKYIQATATFHQWRDSRQVYGLNFQKADDAEIFARSMMESLDALQAPPRPSPAAAPQPPVYQQNHQNAPDLRHDVHNSMQQQSASPSQPSVQEPPAVPRAPPGPPAPPAAPPAPPVPSTGPSQPPSPQNSAPPAPPGAPPGPPGPSGPPPAPGGAGGPPPPPPPPPPPGPGGAGGGGGCSGGGNDLAAQLAAAKLKKATPKPDSGDEPPPNRPKSGPGGINMMADLQRKLKMRKERAEGGSGSSSPPTTNASNNRISPPDQTPNPIPKNTTKPWEKKITNVAVAGSASPRTQRRFSINSRGNGSGDNIDFDKMKREIMVEMRKEINKMKEDIIEAMKMELNRR